MLSYSGAEAAFDAGDAIASLASWARTDIGRCVAGFVYLVQANSMSQQTAGAVIRIIRLYARKPDLDADLDAVFQEIAGESPPNSFLETMIRLYNSDTLRTSLRERAQSRLVKPKALTPQQQAFADEVEVIRKSRGLAFRAADDRIQAARKALDLAVAQKSELETEMKPVTDFLGKFDSTRNPRLTGQDLAGLRAAYNANANLSARMTFEQFASASATRLGQDRFRDQWAGLMASEGFIAGRTLVAAVASANAEAPPIPHAGAPPVPAAGDNAPPALAADLQAAVNDLAGGEGFA